MDNGDTYVAPLRIVKGSSTAKSNHSRQASARSQFSVCSARSQALITPPATPLHTVRHPLEQDVVFHNYLRAFYHYNPSASVMSSAEDESICVPISQGDVILVHSVHPNGWADGTILSTGARGWLPTNYCEAYDHPAIRTLLIALTTVWDMVRSAEDGEFQPFERQDYIRAMIAGVRYFLERLKCLNRDSSMVQTHAGIRRVRKGLLGDLSTLVRTAKKLQQTLQEQTLIDYISYIHELLDELILQAFKVITRATKFLDIWVNETERRSLSVAGSKVAPSVSSESSITAASTIQSVAERDVVSFNGEGGTDAAKRSDRILEQREEQTDSQQTTSGASHVPSARSNAAQTPNSFARPISAQSKRVSLTHRLSYVGRHPNAQSHKLASDRLRTAHDSFLGPIASFIGLHLHSRSSSELMVTTQQAVSACQSLLAVVEEVWIRDLRRSAALDQARSIMYARLQTLIDATRELFKESDGTDDEDLLVPDHEKLLVAAATDCVRAAGDCVGEARVIIERIGDFDFEPIGLGLTEATFAESITAAIAEIGVEADELPDAEKSLPLTPEEEKLPQLHKVDTNSKPLPDLPVSTPDTEDFPSTASTLVESPSHTSLGFFHGSPTCVPKLITLELPKTEPCPELSHSPDSTNIKKFGADARVDSVGVSVTDTSSTYPGSARDSAASATSRPSTRATTPDGSPSTGLTEPGLLSSFESNTAISSSVHSEEIIEAEVQILEKTYAHELVYNKDGIICGGSLPALIERLTTPDSPPDASFVTTFYLTFRLFTTPVDFAESLIDRFEYVGSSAEQGEPIRLRVYNVFKGWLETHWQADADSSALAVIMRFATDRLRQVLPQAGRNLAELAAKVSEVHGGTRNARFVSALGKTCTAATSTINADTQMPAPIVSYSQLKSLKASLKGSGLCSILDFEPLELARQFTLIESHIFCAIQPEELLALEWTKKENSKAINVRAMSKLSTDLANLVADTILSLEDAKKRALVIKQWVKIAMKCLDLNNYDSLMAIICSLNSSMVMRLKRTWDIISQKTKGRLEELKKIVDVSRNYAVLRKRLEHHVAPCLPFVGIYLTDLTFVDVGNQTTRQLPASGESDCDSVSVINFDKHMRTAKIIGQLQRFQIPYRLQPVPEMQQWMEKQIERVRNSGQANVQHYYRRSLMLEPREAKQQKFSPLDSAASTFSSTSKGSERENSKDKFDFLASLHLTISNKQH